MPKLARVLTAGLLLVLACNPEQPKFAFKHAEKRGKLEANGLRFVLMPDASTPLVNVAVRWDVGSREDPPGKAGLAHVVEHLMFQPRPDGNNSPPLFQSIANLAVGGDMNAYTNTDTTHYYETVRGENLDDAIKIEAMRQFYFFDTITEVEFERERDVVRNEERQNYSNPIGELYQAVGTAVYPKGHAYAKTTIGDDLQISSITLQDAQEFVKKYYAPERATVLVAGGFEPDVAVKSIQKWFGKLPKRAPADRRKVDPITLEPGTSTIEIEADRPMVGIAFAMPASNTKEGEAARFGWYRVFGRTLQETSNWDFATNVTFLPLGGELAPVFLLVIELKSMDKLDDALDWVKKNCRTAYQGFDDGSKVQLEEEENLQKADFIQQLEPLGIRTREVANLIQFGTEVNFDSQELYVFHELDKFSKFDGAFVVKTVKKYIDFDKAKVVIVKATNTGKLGDTAVNGARFNKQSDEAIVNPDVDPKEAMHPIQVKAELKNLESAQHVTLDNGMNVIMLPMHGMPLISAAMAYTNAGEASTPQNPALASAAAQFLHLPMDAEAFQKTGINVRCGAGPDDMECETSGISLYLDVMLNGLERIITLADYNQDSVEKWQKDVKNDFGTKSAQEDMEFLRQRLTAFYGADHPYTVTALLTPENANKVHKDALDDFKRSHYAAGNATLVLVGDFDPKDAIDQVKKVFGGWSRGAKLKPVGPATAKRNGPVYIGVVAKEEPQITLAMGYPAPGGIDGQQAARRIIGDLLQYKVDDIRFKLGTTYGMGAGRRTTLGPTAYQIRGRIDAARAGESLKAIREGVDALRNQDFSVDFVRARRQELHNLMGGSTVTGELTDELIAVARFGLDAGYYGKLAQQIGATPPALIKALIKTELDPNNEIIVIKGSRPQLEKTFADAGIKDVKIVEPDYK